LTNLAVQLLFAVVLQSMSSAVSVALLVVTICPELSLHILTVPAVVTHHLHHP